VPARTPRSPAFALLLGLLLTLAVVVASAWYITWQIAGLRERQSNLADRSRLESLQLLRIQNDLNQLALAMRDMLDQSEPYPLVAWASQFDRIRADLDEALRRQANVAIAQRTPEEATYLTRSVAQFWDAADRIFALAAGGEDAEARAQIQLSLQARQAALSTAVARLLVQNNAAEERTAREVQAIYGRVQQRVYAFLAAALLVIAATGLALIRSNRRVFARMTALSDERRDLARQLIAARESTLREISRELHDEFGQLLTAMGSMLTRAGRHAPDGSPLRRELREINEIAQSALDSVRTLSQALHPSILDELGLESAIESYLAGVERQIGVKVTYTRSGLPQPIDPNVSIQVYRVLQEALTNVARHAGSGAATVRLHGTDAWLELIVEDHGRGLRPTAAAPETTGPPRGSDTTGPLRGSPTTGPLRGSPTTGPLRGSRPTTGLAGMRERAALAGGTLDIETPSGGGTRIRLRVPVTRRAPPVVSRESRLIALPPRPDSRIAHRP
jgi:signal transduction histidine kinase